MKKLLKQFISLIVCLATMLTISSSVFAANSFENNLDTEIIHSTEVEVVSRSEASKYKLYEIDYSENKRDNTPVVPLLLSMCEYSGSEQIDNYLITTYSSVTLESHLSECAEITDISMINGYLYIFYNTKDGLSVILCYNDEGLYDKSIYNETSDIAIIESMGTTVQYTNFRQGSYYEMSDELVAEIDHYIEIGDWDALLEIDDITVALDEDGDIIIGSTYAPASASANGFTNEANLLAHLKTKWPLYTGALIEATTKYSSALNRNVVIAVREDRNAYTKKSASWGSYATGTSLTVIATFLGFSSITVPIAILTAVGIAISTAQQILSAVTLYKSAVYTYAGKRLGYAFDTTVYNSYVRVVSHSGSGEFTGGYLNDGTFNWVHSKISSAYNYSSSSIADSTISLYNAEIAVNGICINFSPD